MWIPLNGARIAIAAGYSAIASGIGRISGGSEGSMETSPERIGTEGARARVARPDEAYAEPPIDQSSSRDDYADAELRLRQQRTERAIRKARSLS